LKVGWVRYIRRGGFEQSRHAQFCGWPTLV
jgi:hypothetical protein